MTKLTDIEGIGRVFAERLSKAGIRSTEKLLEVIATPERLKRLAARTGITERRLLAWATRADRIRSEMEAVEVTNLAAADEPSGAGGGRPSGYGPSGSGGGRPGGGSEGGIKEEYHA